MNDPGKSSRPSRASIALAFCAVYVIWGSTYLAIRYSVETLPPFLMAGTRFLVSSMILYAIARMRGDSPPQRAHWKPAAVVGILLLLTGNGCVCWAEQRVQSSIASVLVSTVPFWMVTFEWLWKSGKKPGGGEILGITGGFVGVVILIAPWESGGAGRVDYVGAAVLLVSAVSWAAGSIYSRHAALPESQLVSTAMEMFVGSLLLLAAGTLMGEWEKVNPAAVSARSICSLVYLIIFGSLIGFTCYLWIVKVTPPSLSSTNAYVNPVVAVLLGWLVAGEQMNGRTLVAAAVIIASVFVITAAKGRVSKEKH